jgi:hypothetical protein
MNTTEKAHMKQWCDQLIAARRLTFLQAPEGWLASLDGCPMSYGETVAVAMGWAFVMSHKSAYE